MPAKNPTARATKPDPRALILERDPLDRFSELLLEAFPQIAGPGFERVAEVVRAEYRGDRPYFPVKSAAEKLALEMRILADFGAGLSLRACARRNGVSKNTACRTIQKYALGRADCPKFAELGTALNVPSSRPPAVAPRAQAEASVGAVGAPAAPAPWPSLRATSTP